LSASYLVRKKSIYNPAWSLLSGAIIVKNDVAHIHNIWTGITPRFHIFMTVLQSLQTSLSVVEYVFAWRKSIFDQARLFFRPLGHQACQIKRILVAGFWFFDQKRENHWSFS
jgi:hypothetical protein